MNRVIVEESCVFRGYPKGATTATENEITVVILKHSELARGYTRPDSDVPLCWSTDTDSPSPTVSEDTKQAPRCIDCKRNVRRPNRSKPCKFYMRLAVVFPGYLKNVYQLQVQASSIFGKEKTPEGSGLQQYGKLLLDFETPSAMVYTRIQFDPDSEIPKLRFSPVRPLQEDELETVRKIMDSKAVAEAIDTDTHQGIFATETLFEEESGYTKNDT